ncbi:hypothetical protein KY284_024120 [Solanum tuberosum]|nr:hypothetical protein KY284_024120 [Solanum tuberosum]
MLQYQKEWLAWALKQESIAKGGILGDDMGMGKTVQAISLVLAKHEIGLAISHSSLLSPAPYILPTVKGTLVICLVIAVIQWINEIDRFTTKGSNTILVYHGANREKNIGSFLQIIPYSYYFCEECDCRALDNRYIQAGTLMNNYANIFNLLTRMRHAVHHPYLVGYSSSALARSGRTTNVVYVEQPCGLCHNPVEDPIVFLMDPWWNAVVERQAQDRIHRIKQYKPIRFVIENTIEERILDLQEKKKLLFEGMVGGASEALECWN